MTERTSAMTAKALPGYEPALKTVLDQVAQLPTERVALEDARGRVLRTAVYADRDQPPFDRSAMDGFAVRSSEVEPGRCFAVSGRIAAGAHPSTFQTPLPAGKVLRIATGAPLPAGADAMIPIERAFVSRDAAQQEQVRFETTVQPWQNIHRRGSDKKAHDVALDVAALPGAMTPHHLGIAAACGAVELTVTRRPRVIVLSTGDEVVVPTTTTDALQPQQIRNSNGPMLSALVAAMGGCLLRHEHVPDEPAPTRDAARRAALDADLVLTIGGVSVGERDHLPAAWTSLGAQTVLHGVAVQPGKPLLAATIDLERRKAQQPALVLGLPGNPVSVLATAHLFAWPVTLALLMGSTRAYDVFAQQWHPGILTDVVKVKASRQVFRFARGAGADQVAVLPWQGSGDLMHTAGARCLVRLPMQEGSAPAGTVVPCLPLLK